MTHRILMPSNLPCQWQESQWHEWSWSELQMIEGWSYKLYHSILYLHKLYGSSPCLTEHTLSTSIVWSHFIVLFNPLYVELLKLLLANIISCQSWLSSQDCSLRRWNDPQSMMIDTCQVSHCLLLRQWIISSLETSEPLWLSSELGLTPDNVVYFAYCYSSSVPMFNAPMTPSHFAIRRS